MAVKLMKMAKHKENKSRKWKKTSRTVRIYQEMAGYDREDIFHLCRFQFFFFAQTRFAAMYSEVVLPRLQKWPKMTKNDPKWPKMTQNMYTNPRGSYLKTSIFGDFSTFYDPFQSFSGSGAFLGGWLKRKNWRKLTKNDKKCQKKYPTCPDSPEQLV